MGGGDWKSPFTERKFVYKVYKASALLITLSLKGLPEDLHYHQPGCREEALLLINIPSKCLPVISPWQGTLPVLRALGLLRFRDGGGGGSGRALILPLSRSAR